MKIDEAYKKFNKQLIILISGLSGSGKNKIASFIERDFKIEHLNIDDYCKNNYSNYIEILEGVKINDWDHIDSYDWDKINEKITELKSDGIIVSGPYFPINKLTNKQDFHINIKISKQKLIENRHNFIKENPDKCADLVQYLDTPIELAIINKMVYPHYLEYTEKSKIDKYMNANELSIDEIYDNTYDYLISKITQSLDKYNEILLKEHTEKHKIKHNTYDEFRDYNLSKDAIHLGQSDEFDLA